MTSGFELGKVDDMNIVPGGTVSATWDRSSFCTRFYASARDISCHLVMSLSDTCVLGAPAQ